MKHFPSKVGPSNIEHFKQYHFQRQLCYLRKEIYEWMISPAFFEHNERCFDLQLKGYSNDTIESVCKELEELGWYTRLAFNNSALYIYKEGENPCKFVGMFEEI